MVESARLASALLGTALTLAGCVGAGGNLRTDPALVSRYQGGGNHALLSALLTGKPDAPSQVNAWLERNPAVPAKARAVALALLCEDHFRRSQYAAALKACREADVASGTAATAAMQALLEPLKDLPPPRWATPGAAIPLVKDGDGVRRLHVGPATGRIEAIFDTGAEISVVMESVARKLGVRAGSAASLATTTTPVAGSVGVIDRLEIGDTALLNLPVVVLPDAQLRFPDGASIPMVLGLPVLIEARRFAVRGNGTQLLIGEAVRIPQSASSAPLYWDPSGIGMAAEFAGGTRAVHFDSGSGRTYLFPAALAVVSKAELATRRDADRTISGLGGARREKASRLDLVCMRIARQGWLLAPVEVSEHDENGEAARIGAALFDRFGTVTVDFETMRMWLTR